MNHRKFQQRLDELVAELTHAQAQKLIAALQQRGEGEEVQRLLNRRLEDDPACPPIAAKPTHSSDRASWVVAVLLNSDLPWGFLRKVILGDTFPERAMEGSVRNMLLHEFHRLELAPVGVSANCVHLSAGPFEALFEIRNMLGHMPDAYFEICRTNLSRVMNRYGLGSCLESTLCNPKLRIGTTQHRLFSITENTDTQSAVSLYMLGAGFWQSNES